MGRRGYQKTVCGTFLVVSFVWLSITIVIVMYHEELMKSRRLREYNQEYEHLDEMHHLGPYLGNQNSGNDPDDNHNSKLKHNIKYNYLRNLTMNRDRFKLPKSVVGNVNNNDVLNNKPYINDMLNQPPRKKSPFIQKLKDNGNKIDPKLVDEAKVGDDTKSDSYYESTAESKNENQDKGSDLKPDVPEINDNKVPEAPHEVNEKPAPVPRVIQQEHREVEKRGSKGTETKPHKQQDQQQKNAQQPGQGNQQQENPEEKAAQMIEADPMKLILQQIKDVINNVNGDSELNQGNKKLPKKSNESENKKQEFVNPLGLDFDAIEPRASPDAPGEMGKSYVVHTRDLPPVEKEKYDKMFEQHQFNKYVSDKISVRRRLPDKRIQSCKDVVFDKPLPRTSIIICFHNEAWSVLLRTIWSILDRSPLNLIKEIILVDDFSSLGELKKPLEDYMAQLKIVKIVRTKKREGLIRARLLGYSVATGEVLTFLDSHCECVFGWLEPMLTRIAENQTRAVAPVINSIGHHAFGVDQHEARDVGIVHLDTLSFHWGLIPKRETQRRTSPTEPYRSPTMAGGIFSISKEYFAHLGLYDAGMEIWGGENLEMSFRIWTCGGSIELHPCSHVAHVFRFKSPYNWGRDPQLILKKNTIRVGEVWLDEYRFHYYENHQYRLGNFGDVSERKALRQRLQCKPFSWYIENVYPEMTIPEPVLYSGEVRNVAYDQCLDSMGQAPAFPKAQPCHGLGGNEYFRYFKNGEVRMKDVCLVAREEERVVVWNVCAERQLRFWDYTDDNHFVVRGTNLCLDVTEGKQKLKLNPCSSSSTQKWTWTRKLADIISGKTSYLGTGVRNKFIQ
ncbi:polypeptide N-acetylgalactosaminyltransferase 5-like [Mizuhopecten yessoensis]|uniref:Polypeptide N-acetylgalactosaminyltransferase n=1 Tax=Mizuhopecten yessoensis TaxID=6573 RepID=A0A210R347_MIZYE|nr:polypeptide N-acetylgalactosaminyltransferase 5-like [Mizuhopecten yessoensis]OWF55483.1 Polypeptide N-acetylgalactosaminyltransferase 5 [Mizuhopecten yessoensis]